jgi:hypothetical protein
VRKIRHADGTVHFSQLKQMARSPAHYKVACETPFVPSKSMRVGTIAHRLILGARDGHRIVCFDGDRRGKAWTAFAAEHRDSEIVTGSEWLQASAIAAAVSRDPVAQRLLDGSKFEVPLKWKDAGFACSTEGVDFIGFDFLGDLKTTSTTQPAKWSRQAFSMVYYAQLAWYQNGARANGHKIRACYALGVETTPPFAVVSLEATTELLELGRREIVLWLERLRTCEDNDHWPTYVDASIPWEPPAWMAEAGAEGDDGEALVG